MAVTMNDVRAALDPEEPDYPKAAQLGPDALPHLEVLVNSGDTMLASKAAYLASLIKDAKAAEIVGTAAQSDDPAVRVAAAAAASNLTPSGASAVLVELVGDPDPGVRKVARASVPDKPTTKLAKKLEDLGDEGGPAREVPAELDGGDRTTGPMPGETAGEEAMMPGEGPAGMPGEQQTMPGEREGMTGE
jgi:HEAT repeat protein